MREIYEGRYNLCYCQLHFRLELLSSKASQISCLTFNKTQPVRKTTQNAFSLGKMELAIKQI